MNKMTTEKLYANEHDCCGCELCSQVCPNGTISIKKNAEGFYYPAIENNDSCIGCHLCEKVCPIKHVCDIQSEYICSYAGWAKNEDEIVSSSSGGFATVAAKKIIKIGGVVYGASYSSDYKSVEYIRVDKFDELFKLKTSKYVQSRKDSIYRMVKNDAMNGIPVLFIGTPCDCAAVNNYVGNHENLYIISLVCHGPTSEMVHRQYCELLENKYNSSLESFSVRYKKDGKWKPYYINASFANQNRHIERFDQSIYNTAFLFFKRPACNVCVFKKNRFSADLLIGDFHVAVPGMDTYNEHGVSSIIVLTSKGKSIVNDIADEFQYKDVPINISTHQTAINKPLKARFNRTHFSKQIVKCGIESACKLPSIGIINRYDSFVTKLKVIIVRIKKKLR